MSVNLNVSDFKLERYLAGDLPAEEMQELRLREESDEIFRAKVKSLREEGASILAANPFGTLESRLDQVDEIFGRGNVRSLNATALFLRVAAVMVVALGIFAAVFMVNGEKVVNGGVHETAAGQDVAMISGGEAATAADAMGSAAESETRIKGMESRLEVWKKSGETAVQMENLGEAQEGDELQLRYSVPEKCYGLLFSMDGNGVITVHVGNGSGSVALEPGKMVTLPFAYKLDNAPHFEKFFLLTSKNTFAIDGYDIDGTMKQAGITVVEFTVRKARK